MFFTSKSKIRKRYDQLGKNVAAVLNAKYQLLATIGKHVDENGVLNKRAVGYGAGFTAQALASYKLDSNELYHFGVTKMVFEGVWGTGVVAFKRTA
jgi:hypothetical protein